MALYVDIEKSFGDFKLISKFEAGKEVLSILGASGCGKSVTLKCIAGIEKPDRGRIVMDGKVLFDSEKKINIPARKRKVGYLFQNYALFPNMTVVQNIACGIQGDKEERERSVKKLIEDFYLEGCEAHYPYQLSGGQQQRVALARMLATKPSLIMLDEPFSALDDYLKWQLEQEILATIEAFPGTVLFVSHNRDEVFRMSDRIAVMDRGRIEVLEGKKELFSNPQTLQATLLTGCKNITRVEVLDEHRVFAIDWGIPIRLKEAVIEGIQYLGFRSHYFQPVERMEESNVFQCEVLKIIEDTFSMIIMFRQAGSEESCDYNKLRYEFSKNEWHANNKLVPEFLKIPEDQLIQMR